LTHLRNNSRTSNCQCSLFSKKNPIIRIFCKPGELTVQINSDKWSSTVFLYVVTNLSETDSATTFEVDVSQFGNLKDYTEWKMEWVRENRSGRFWVKNGWRRKLPKWSSGIRRYWKRQALQGRDRTHLYPKDGGSIFPWNGGTYHTMR